MRNKLSLVLCVSAVTTCACSIASAATLPTALQARYTALLASIEKCDLNTYDTFYAKDYVSVDPSGKTYNRAQYMSGMREIMAGATKASIRIQYTGVKTRNGIVEVSFDCTGKIFKPGGNLVFREVGVDSWKKIGNTWMEIKTVDKVMNFISPTQTGSTKTIEREAHNAYVAAINANNIESLLAVLTNDVVYLAPNAPALVGKAAIRQWGADYLATYKIKWDKTTLDFTVAGDWAIERYAYKSLDTPRAGGAALRDTGKGINIYHHDSDGKWRVARDAWNSDLPLPTR